MARRLRTQRGVGLVELLVAAAILVVCVVPITGSISYLRTNAMQAKIEAQVQDQIQTILNGQLDNAKLTTLIKTVVPTVTTQTLAGGVTVTYNLTIAPVSGYSKLYALTCSATWAAASTASRTDTVTVTLYALTV